MRGAYRFCSSSPPRCLLRRAHTSTGAFSRPSAYLEVSTVLPKASFSVQRLTIRISSLGSAGLRSDPGSDSFMYVHSTDIAFISLMAVVQLVVYAPRIVCSSFPRRLLRRPYTYISTFPRLPTYPEMITVLFKVSNGLQLKTLPKLGWTANSKVVGKI